MYFHSQCDRLFIHCVVSWSLVVSDLITCCIPIGVWARTRTSCELILLWHQHGISMASAWHMHGISIRRKAMSSHCEERTVYEVMEIFNQEYSVRLRSWWANLCEHMRMCYIKKTAHFYILHSCASFTKSSIVKWFLQNLQSNFINLCHMCFFSLWAFPRFLSVLVRRKVLTRRLDVTIQALTRHRHQTSTYKSHEIICARCLLMKSLYSIVYCV